MLYLLTQSVAHYLALFDYRSHYQQIWRYIYLASSWVPFYLTKIVSENSFLFTVSNHDRHRDRNKAIIRVTGTAAGRWT